MAYYKGRVVTLGKAHLVMGVGDDVVLQELSGHLQLDQEACQVGPLLQLRQLLQQPEQDVVDHRLTAHHQALAEAAPVGVKHVTESPEGYPASHVPNYLSFKTTAVQWHPHE